MRVPTQLEALLKDRVATAVGPELLAVEQAIAREIASPVGLIHEMGDFIAGAGGKRLRPILLLMAARLAGYTGPRAVRMGCVVELLHTATLIHDDVVDQAPLRRGRPSANARWGDDASLLVGDHLYSKSFALMVQDGDAAVLETLARATVSMTEAEVFQLERKRSGTTSEADYLRIITQKTASFMSACCRIGALLARAEEKQVEGLTRFGLDIGIAFQMSDDSLDFVADQARLGKAVGADLREGKRTLPLIATLDRASPAERDRAQSLLRSRALATQEIEEIRRLVVKYEGVEYALARAHAYAQSAKEALQPFKDCEDKETLALVADFVVDRDR
ncbi:MAG TPA: polyprenyl synthetase family protein [Methylomirabilota bacterium]|nr:polyprenyl synthetase family protein [Methylomirabilota bacterium]